MVLVDRNVGINPHMTSLFSNSQSCSGVCQPEKLDTETKILQANATQFAKQTMQWLKLVEDFNQSLKVNLVRQNSLLRNEWDYSQQWSARWSCPELYCKFKLFIRMIYKSQRLFSVLLLIIVHFLVMNI